MSNAEEKQALVLATRRSPLALAQARETASRIAGLAGVECRLLEMVTTGDKRLEWSLEKQGGKGLFTSELEAALKRGEAQVAVHSSKDLPTEMEPGLVLAACLPRENPRDMLILREGVAEPKVIATSSPRRRLQLLRQFPGASFVEIRGNVDTRLRKLAEGAADASMLACAGLARLGIRSWQGLVFRPLEFSEMVPAVGQAAIGLQSTAEWAERVSAWGDRATFEAVSVERHILRRLGGGCQASVAAHCTPEGHLWLFHEKTGPWNGALAAPQGPGRIEEVDTVLRGLGLVA